jgi:DNA-binding transcriptional MerR regulator
VAAIFVICALVVVNLLFKDDIKFSETEIRQWENKGFHIDEARDWKAAGFSPSNASEWREESFNPKEAKEWKNGGFNVRYAAKWKPAASNLEKTKELLASGFDRNRPEEVLCYSDKGFSLDEIKQLKLKDFKCDQAFEWRNNGFTTENIIVLSDLGFNSNAIGYAMQWQNAGFSPDEIVELVKSGFQKTDVNKAAELREKGYSIKEIANLTNSDKSVHALRTNSLAVGESEVTSPQRERREKDKIENNKYAKIFTKNEQETLINLYKSNLKTNYIIMDYVNLYVDSPQTLYQELAKSECDPEILEFVKHNKEFTLAYLHIVILKVAFKEGPTDAEVAFITSYIKSPTALAATSQMELTMETQLMRESLLFSLWEKVTAPGGFKEVIEAEFYNQYETHVNKDNGNSQKG